MIGWVQVCGAFTLCACSTLFEFVSFWPSHHFCYLCFVWFCCMFWLVFISCGVKDMWAFGLMFPVFYPFFGLGVAWAKALIFLLSPCFSFLCLWASWLLILPYHFIVSAVAIPSLLLRVTPWTRGLMCQSTFLSILYSRLPRLTFYIFTSFGLNWPTFLLCQPFYHFISRAFSAHLLHFYLFYSHGLFARSFGLPWPNYHISIFYCFLSLLAFKPT